MPARQFRDADLIAGRWPRLIACQVRARRIIEPAGDDRPAARRSLRLAASAWLARKAALGFEVEIHEVANPEPGRGPFGDWSRGAGRLPELS